MARRCKRQVGKPLTDHAVDGDSSPACRPPAAAASAGKEGQNAQGGELMGTAERRVPATPYG